MIIVKLIGGLGNQMFQYAAARALALKHGVPLKVDVSFLNQSAQGAYTQRHYELNCFQANVSIASNQENSVFESLKNNRVLRVIQRNFPFLFSKIYFAESGNVFHKQFNQLPKNVYLDGYWQNEVYFNEIRDILLKDFTLNEKAPEQALQFLNKIQNTNSVSLHVRRGDYVNLSSANAFHGVCGAAYYQLAVKKLQTLEKNIELFIFSDDINWCKANLSFEHNTHFVEHSCDAYWDMYLMSCCKHNIIANSSFSWWAAWLNQHTNKRVLAPEYWYTQIKTNSLGILANNWIVVA